jgi:hypothetical protein
MSDNKSRFILKKGDIEIEYEGQSEEVKNKFNQVFEWLKGAPASTPSPQDQTNQRKGTASQEKKNDGRGGARSKVISPEIDKLISGGFLNSFKTVDEVLAELKRKTVIAGFHSVTEALKRRVPETLDRIQNEEGKWVYRKKQIG